MSKHNGWTNYETWRIHLQLFNGLSPEDVACEGEATAADIRDMIQQHIFDYDRTPDFVLSWAWEFAKQANWQEIADAINKRQSREERELLDRYAERCQYGWIVDPDGRRELFRDADKALLEIGWLLEATDLESEYPAK